jgi:Domain of unknown function (DUF4375)
VLRWVAPTVAVLALVGGCGGHDDSEQSAADVYQEVRKRDSTEPAPDDSRAEETLRRDRAEARRRFGTRPDFRIPPAAIRGKDDYEVWMAVTDRIFLELKTPYSPDPRFDRLGPGQRALYVLSWADAEIGNGGFSQFYFNSTGYFAPDLPAAAARIGATENARLARAANRLLAGGAQVPRDRNRREALLDRVSEDALSRIDERWFDTSETLAKEAAAYVRRHPHEFLAP